MLHLLTRSTPKSWIFLAFIALGAACSAGETGLVLGRPLPVEQGGTTMGGSETTPTMAGTGLGGAPGEAGTPAQTDAGAGGAPTTPEDWVVTQCSPRVAFTNRDPTGDGKAFDDVVSDPQVLMWQATHAVCRTLFRSSSEVEPVTDIAFDVGPFSGVAGTGDNAITLNASYVKMQADAGANILQEITGILHFQASFLYQNAGRSADAAATRWVLFGIADYVRLSAGYIGRQSRTAPTTTYDKASSKTIAFFFDYLAASNPDIVYQLNQRLSPNAGAWSNDVFVTFMGSDLDTLWAAYLRTF